MMVGREPAHRIRPCGVPGELKRLTAAPTEVDLFARAATARFQHPSITSEPGERGGVVPDLVQGTLSNVVDVEPDDLGRGWAGQRASVRCDDNVSPSPAMHARFRVRLVIVGDHVQDL
jgi:hypothetical protein